MGEENKKNMKQISIIALLMMVCCAVQAQYRTDTLGDGYECRTVLQADDYDGKVVCTVIRKMCASPSHKAMVYVHGYNDYFFQSELGDSAIAHGYNFYAVDLRKYGRSLLPHQDAFFCKKMSEYFPDIDTTIAIAKAEGNDTIVLMGHSTGGLSTSLYLNSKYGHVGDVNALVLNSPFLDWNMSKMMEKFIIPVVGTVCYPFKRMKTYGESKEPSGYAKSLHKKYLGEWDFDTSLKMDKGHTKRMGWVNAISKGQRKLRRHSNISCPILVMSSDTSIMETDQWQEGYKRADIVLDVNDIERYGKKLGNNVTYVQIAGGKHDLILSEKDARDKAYKTIFRE